MNIKITTIDDEQHIINNVSSHSLKNDELFVTVPLAQQLSMSNETMGIYSKLKFVRIRNVKTLNHDN